MSLWTRRSKKEDTPELPKTLDEFVEFVYVSGFNYGFSLADSRKYKRKPFARQQYRRWLDKLKESDIYKEFHGIEVPENHVDVVERKS